jgi:GNAT superfamily N-acetyltransferase
MVGCLGLTDEGAGEARLRWFVLDPPLRGRGFGRALLNELFAKAEAVGYERITLETFSDLAAAAHLYRERGFELIWEDTRPRWGRPAVTYQHYELELTPSERPRRGPPEGGSLSEPASVPPRGGRAGAAPMAAGRRPRSTQAA